ncbi:hypothetical protein BVC80_8533g10 [Macleaya cordata]|uniref:Uncharacterized protein n=1 Tax=Macleaya cordata TaxID=56857 RepID=A0A200PMG4_MACCD|nr:hypothetical protein BVC80_8533g10 [Macleaya cordata]
MEKEQRENRGGERKEEETYMGIPIHNQVKKIKQEYEKIKDPSPDSPVQPEIRPAVLREINRQLSRSPLGRSTGRPISVGDS